VGPLRLALIAVLAVHGTASAAPPPRGERARRPRPTHVIVEPTALAAAGVSARVAPGVAVALGAGGARSTVTIAGPVEITGRVDARALGARLQRDAELHDAAGAVVGRARAGALLRTVGKGKPGRTRVELPAPLGGRFEVDASALGAGPRELVLPVYEAALLAATGPAALAASPGGAPRVTLGAGTRVEPLGLEDRGFVKVRTYGGVAVEGWAPAGRLAAAGAEAAGPSRGLTPTHEALVDAPLHADAAGRRAVGTLRGGALVAVGVEKSGPLVKVMTHGDVVAELWVPLAALRPLEASVWAEAR
jgi:hypothetical protein